MKRLILIVFAALCALPVFAQVQNGQPLYQLPQNAVPQKWYGSGAPTSVKVSGIVQPGDLYFDTTTPAVYYCGAAVSATVPPLGGASACTSVTTAQWTLISGSSGNGGSVLIGMTAGTGGTTQYELVKIAAATVVKTLTTDTAPDVAFGVAQSTAIATGSVQVAVNGVTNCVADTGGITAGDLVGAGTTVASTCVDLGQTVVSSVAPNIAIVGRALTTVSATANASILLFPQTGAGYAATGTGNYVRATSPTLVTPVLGTVTSGNVAATTGQQVTCASTAACPSTAEVLRVVTGIGLLATGSPSTYAVTTISPAFTSASTYTCTAQDVTTIANNIGVLTAGYVSGSAVTFTGPNTNTDTFRFTCIGY